MKAEMLLMRRKEQDRSEVAPCQTPVAADAYISVSTPGGASIYLQRGGSFALAPTPMIAGWNVASFNGTVFNYTFRGGEPVGTHTVNAFLNRPGTTPVIASASLQNFTFEPQQTNKTDVFLRFHPKKRRPVFFLLVVRWAEAGSVWPWHTLVLIRRSDRHDTVLRASHLERPQVPCFFNE